MLCEQRGADDRLRSEFQVTNPRALDNVLSLICRMFEIGITSTSQIKVPMPNGSCHLASRHAPLFTECLWIYTSFSGFFFYLEL